MLKLLKLLKLLKIIIIHLAFITIVINNTYPQDPDDGYVESKNSVVIEDGSHIYSTFPVTTSEGNENAIHNQTDPVKNIVNKNNSIHNWVLYFSEKDRVIQDVSFTDYQTGYISMQLGYVYKTTNGGLNWTVKLNLGSNYYWYGVYALSPDTVVISGFLNDGTGIIRWSFDGGNAWTPDIIIGNKRLDRIHFFDQDNGVVIAGITGDSYYTTNGGKNSTSWNHVHVGSTLTGMYDFQSTGKIFATGFNLAFSSNKGISWSVSPSVDSVFDGGVDFIEPDNNYGWTSGGEISPFPAGWIHRTTNGGSTWSGRLNTFPFPTRAVKFFNNNSGIVAGGSFLDSDGAIYSTTNGGDNWIEDINTSANMVSIDVVSVTGTDSIDVWCVGTTGPFDGLIGKAYKIRMKIENGTGINTLNENVPANFVLNQNYPNPFNPTTVISYELKKAAFITLKIFDINGKEISTLVNQKQIAGNYSVKFGGTNLPSGEYFYKLRSDDYSETKKMIILK